MPVRHPIIALCLPLALIVGGCGGPAQNARKPVITSTPRTVQPIRTVTKKTLDKDALERIALRSAKAGKHQAAAMFYSNGLKKSPDKLSLKLGLAKSLMALGGYHGAVRLYRELLTRAPDNPEIRRNLGRALIGVNQASEGVWYLEELITKAPTAGLLNDAGIAHHLLGNFQQSQSYFRRALAMTPGRRIMLNNLAVSLALSGSPDEGERLLNSLARQPRSPEVIRLNLAYVGAVARGAPAKNKRLVFLTERSPKGFVPLAARFPAGAADRQFASAQRPPKPLKPGHSGQRDRQDRQAMPRKAAPAGRASVDRQPLPAQARNLPAAPGPGGIASSYATVNRAATPAPRERSRAISPQNADNGRKTMPVALSGRSGRYVVQLGAFEDKGNAQAAITRMARKAPRLINDNPLTVEATETRDMGLLFRVRTSGTMNRGSADGLCAALKTRSLRCFVGTIR